MQGGLHPASAARVVRGAAARHQGALSRRSTSTGSARRRSTTSPRLPSCRCGRCSSGCKEAGLGSLPGGGGEILVDRVRKEITRGKVLTDDWLNVHRVWHELGGRSTATMMFGHVETLAERIEHLERVRAVAGRDRRPHGVHLLDVSARAHRHGRRAAGRRVRVPQDAGHLRGFTSTTFPTSSRRGSRRGRRSASSPCYFGANDMGSLMIEENVVASAGTVHYLSLDQIKRRDSRAGLHPAPAERLLRVHRRRAAAMTLAA